MSEPTVKEMTLYLQNAMELESSVYSQERSIREIDRQVRRMTAPKAKDKGKAPANQAERIAKPVNKAQEAKLSRNGWIIFAVAGVVVFIVCTVYMMLEVWYTSFFKAISPLLIGFLLFEAFCAWCINVTVKTMNTRNKEYELAMRDYEKKVQEAERQYALQREEYNAKVQAIKEEHEQDIAVFNEKKTAVMALSTQIAVPLADTKKILEQLYSVNWIFPKYRNLTAICTIYEYFAAGRCTELTGPNGAYNLYESELRQNRIIDRLDTIISELEEIKQNQYTLYTEIRKTNKILEGISQDVKCIMESTNQIAESTNVIQQCAMVTAQNTEALKYIALIQ